MLCRIIACRMSTSLADRPMSVAKMLPAYHHMMTNERTVAPAMAAISRLLFIVITRIDPVPLPHRASYTDRRVAAMLKPSLVAHTGWVGNFTKKGIRGEIGEM